MSVTDNLHEVRQRINQAAVRAGRDPSAIKLVAVTKNVPVNIIKELLNNGEYYLGENRVQELLLKQPVLPPEVEWHFIGHLQRNKVAKIIGIVDLIHSLDRWPLAEELSRRAEKRGISCDVLVQVNVAGEASKFGLAPGEVTGFIREASRLKGLRIKGLMTIAPFAGDPEEVRPVFRELRLLAERIKYEVPGVSMDCLSMGMSSDFTVAVEEGATIVRVGTAIFSSR